MINSITRDQYGCYAHLVPKRTKQLLWRYRSGNKLESYHLEINEDDSNFDTLEEFVQFVHYIIDTRKLADINLDRSTPMYTFLSLKFSGKDYTQYIQNL